MEEAEQKLLEAYRLKKNTERTRKQNRKGAHQKVVSRQISKQFLQNIKGNAFAFLKDVGYFNNKFKDETMYGDVLPWLTGKTEGFVQELDSLSKYSDTVIFQHIHNVSKLHQQKVEEQTAKLNAIKEENER